MSQWYTISISHNTYIRIVDILEDYCSKSDSFDEIEETIGILRFLEEEVQISSSKDNHLLCLEFFGEADCKNCQYLKIEKDRWEKETFYCDKSKRTINLKEKHCLRDCPLENEKKKNDD